MNALLFVLGMQAMTRVSQTERDLEKMSREIEEMKRKERGEQARSDIDYEAVWRYASESTDEGCDLAVIVVAVIFILAMFIASAYWVLPKMLYATPSDYVYARVAEAKAETEIKMVEAEAYVDVASVEREAEAMVAAMMPGEVYFDELIYVNGIPEDALYNVDGRDELYRERAKDNIIQYALYGEAAREAYESEPTGELLGVTGAVLEWRDYGLYSGKLKRRYWLIDQDGDGTWDWAARAKTADGDTQMVFLAADGADPEFDSAVEAHRLPEDWVGTTRNAQRQLASL